MASKRPVRAYTYELCDSFVPRGILNVLGEPQHVQWARIVVFAETAIQAHSELVTCGMGTWNQTLPTLAHGSSVNALTIAEYNKSGSVFVIANQGGRVAEVFPLGEGSRLIGAIESGLLVNATRESDRAVCDACGWEGTEDDIEQHNDAVTGDTCPNCGQHDVNYFFAG